MEQVIMCSIPQFSFDFTVGRNPRKCSLCHELKELSDYHLMGRGKYRPACKECWNKKKRDNYDALETRWQYIERKYKVSREWYQSTLELQGYTCAICREEDTAMFYGKQSELAVDHCHTTGKVRGLLCRRCNTSLERIDTHGEQWVINALEYMKTHT